MLGRRSLELKLEHLDSEIERTFHQQKRATNLDKIEETEAIVAIGDEIEERPFRDYFSPLANLSTSCIQYPQVTARNFELKPSVLNCLPSFYGLDSEENLIII